jgi:HAMP domain-containing protein
MRLANPLYYFDLDAIGSLARPALRESDVEYVLVYDTQGRILHDGSGDIAAYGQPMGDVLAKEVIAARGPHTRASGQVLDVSSPILIGDQRLGGVRIGYSLASMAKAEEQAMRGLRGRINEVGRRSLGWLLLLSLALGVVGLAAAALVQRLLVQPITQLGDAAREIESGNFACRCRRPPDELGDMRTWPHARKRGQARPRYPPRGLQRCADSLSNRPVPESLTAPARLAGRGLATGAAVRRPHDFKRVNDTPAMRPATGPAVVAGRIDRAVKSINGADAMVARFGEDEL